jgi:hypothetical protein
MTAIFLSARRIASHQTAIFDAGIPPPARPTTRDPTIHKISRRAT